jgi:hypothetical protein
MFRVSFVSHHWLFHFADWGAVLNWWVDDIGRQIAASSSNYYKRRRDTIAFFNSNKTALRQSTITLSNQPLFFSFSTSPLSRFLKKL